MTIVYLSIFVLFALWISLQEKRGISNLLGFGTAAMMVIFLIQVYAGTSSMEDKLGLMAVSMLLLGCYSALFSMIKNPVMRLALLGAGLILGNKAINQTLINSKTIDVDPTGEIILRLDANSEREIALLESKYDVHLVPTFTPDHYNTTDLDDYYTIDIADDRLSEIKSLYTAIEQEHSVRELIWNTIYKSTLTIGEAAPQRKGNYLTNDPMRNRQWNLDAIKYDEMLTYIAHNNIKPRKTARLFILDSGIDSAHEEMNGVYRSLASRYDSDIKGHGTHCAGVAAASNNNGKGISSVIPSAQWATVTSISVLGDNGFGSRKTILEGMITAVDQGADVISMSLGGLSLFGSRGLYDQAVDYANDNGAIVVVAAGNSNSDADSYSPANSSGSITVSAIDENLNRAAFSNTVQNIEKAVAAPGTNILSAFPGNRYETYNGTSMATPHVAGLIAVLRSVQPRLTVDQAYTILRDTGMPTGDTRLTGKLIYPKEALRRAVER